MDRNLAQRAADVTRKSAVSLFLEYAPLWRTMLATDQLEKFDAIVNAFTALQAAETE